MKISNMVMLQISIVCSLRCDIPVLLVLEDISDFAVLVVPNMYLYRGTKLLSKSRFIMSDPKTPLDSGVPTMLNSPGDEL